MNIQLNDEEAAKTLPIIQNNQTTSSSSPVRQNQTREHRSRSKSNEKQLPITTTPSSNTQQPTEIIATPTPTSKIVEPTTATTLVSSTIVSSSLPSIDTDITQKQADTNSIAASTPTTTTITTTNINSVSSTTKPILNSTIKSILNENLINIHMKDVSPRIELISDLRNHLTPAWSGQMALKKLTFMTNFYLVAGSTILKEQILPISNSVDTTNNLHISQRLRLDSTKLDDIEKRLCDANLTMETCDKVPFSIFLLLPADTTPTLATDVVNQNKQKTLQSLIYYLDQKSAAGVIPMPDEVKPVGNVYVFTPSSSFAARILKQTLPNLKCSNNDEQNQLVYEYSDFLVVVILKFNN